MHGPFGTPRVFRPHVYGPQRDLRAPRARQADHGTKVGSYVTVLTAVGPLRWRRSASREAKRFKWAPLRREPLASSHASRQLLPRVASVASHAPVQNRRQSVLWLPQPARVFSRSHASSPKRERLVASSLSPALPVAVPRSLLSVAR